MEIYLVQHGESKSEAEDPARPLTERGKEEVESVARYMAGLGAKVARILHSGKLRARETAELFARHLVPPQGIAEQEGLGPLDDPYKAEQLVSQVEGAVMIVGHLPHLERLASLLILGEPEKRVVKFRMGGVVCLDKSGEGWSIEWAVVPPFARHMGQGGGGEKRV